MIWVFIFLFVVFLPFYLKIGMMYCSRFVFNEGEMDDPDPWNKAFLLGFSLFWPFLAVVQGFMLLLSKLYDLLK